MNSLPLTKPVVCEDATKSFVWSLCRVSDRAAWSPSAAAFVGPTAYTPPAAGSTTSSNPDCYMPMVRFSGGLAANLIGLAPGIPAPAKGDGYLTIVLDAVTGETFEGPTPISFGPYDYTLNVAFSVN